MTGADLHRTDANGHARLGEIAGASVPLDYGDPAAEYRAVRESAGVAERSDLAHLLLRGRDPIRMVQGLITNDLAAAPPNRVVYGAMLTPKGRTIAELRAGAVQGADGIEVRMDLPREVLAAATDHLRRSIPPLYAKWTDVSADVGTLGVYGPRSGELVSAVLGEVPSLSEDERAESTFDEVAVQLVGTLYAGGEEGFDLTTSAAVLPRLRAALLEAGLSMGVRAVGFSALETLRVEAGHPRGGHELTQETIPTEAFESTGMMERAISFGKGCYTGQEVIIRIAHRGHVNRRLRGVVLPTGALPAEGTRIFHAESGKDAGWTTTAVESPLMGGPIALAFVRREVEPGQPVHVGEPSGRESTVQALPFVRRRDSEPA